MESTTINIPEDQIRQVAEAKIAETCQRHGVTRDALKSEVIGDAYDYAKQKLTAEAEQKANPFYLENKRLREELRIAQMQSSALRDAKAPVSVKGEPVELTLDRAIARVGGIGTWNHGLSPDQRLAAVGINPSEVTASTKAEIAEVFGKGSSVRAAELRRSDPAKYSKLKLIGKVLRTI